MIKHLNIRKSADPSRRQGEPVREQGARHKEQEKNKKVNCKSKKARSSDASTRRPETREQISTDPFCSWGSASAKTLQAAVLTVGHDQVQAKPDKPNRSNLELVWLSTTSCRPQARCVLHWRAALQLGKRFREDTANKQLLSTLVQKQR